MKTEEELKEYLFTSEDKERCLRRGALFIDCFEDMIDTMIHNYNALIIEINKK